MVPFKILRWEGKISPVDALSNWHEKRPELFKTGVYNHPGLDMIPNIFLISKMLQLA